MVRNPDGSIILSTKVDTGGVSRALDIMKNKFAALKDQKITITTLTQAIKDQQYAIKQLEMEYSILVAKGKGNSAQAAELKARIVSLKTELGQLRTAATTLGVKAGKSFSSMAAGLKGVGKRVAGIIKSALIFSVIYRVLQSVVKLFKNILMSNNQFKQDWEELKAAFYTAAYPIINLIIPAVKWIVQQVRNWAVSLGKVAAVLSGMSYSELVNQAKASKEAADNYEKMSDSSKKTAKNVSKQLASFDEIQTLSSGKDDDDEAGQYTGFEGLKKYDTAGEKTMLGDLMNAIGGALMAVGIILLFHGQIAWGIGFIIAGAIGIAAATLTDESVSQKAKDELSNALLIVGMVAILLGILLCMAQQWALMIYVSQAYTDLMKSPIRPKVQPVITVSGIDNEGNEVFLKWEAKNIKDLKYKREIDPIGRTLPYMELTWTEIYRDKMSLENYPEKYKNIVKHMKVELSFVQDLAFFSSWKTIFKSGRTWKQIFEEGKTWRDLKNKVDTETITLPSMFLTARPTIEGKTIKWTARDLLYFLDEKQTAYFAGPIPFVNPLKYLLLNARGAFLKSRDIFDALTRTANGIAGFEALENEWIIFDDATKNTLKNYANLRNAYWDFSGNTATLNSIYRFLNNKGVCTFSGGLLLEYPKLTQGTNVSQYSFKRYRTYEDHQNVYEKTEDESGMITIVAGNTSSAISFARYLYDGCGVVKDGSEVFGAANYAISTVIGQTISVAPVKKNVIDECIVTENIGEPFVEDNPVNPYSASDFFASERCDAITRYFSSSKSAMEFKCLPNLALTPGDAVWVFTNLYDETGAQAVKQGGIVSIELEYNGALKQKLIVHEG